MFFLVFSGEGQILDRAKTLLSHPVIDVVVVVVADVVANEALLTNFFHSNFLHLELI